MTGEQDNYLKRGLVDDGNFSTNGPENKKTYDDA